MIISFAQLAVERVVNSLPEGLLIAFCAWLLLRLMGRQNAGTRFAVWLVALAGVVALPLLDSPSPCPVRRPILLGYILFCSLACNRSPRISPRRCRSMAGPTNSP
jgi:hypothetical protein